MPGPAKRSNAYKKSVGSRKMHSGEDLAPPLIEQIPDPPIHIIGKDDAIAEWQRVCGLLIEEDMLTEWDLPTIRIMCLEWQRYCDACRDIEEKGEYMQTSTGYEQVRPAHTIRNKSFGHYEKLLVRTGADVVSRAKMKRIRPQEDKKNPFATI